MAYESNRYVRLRCPMCDATSPVCDQFSDARRSVVVNWWAKHKREHHDYPPPIIERVVGHEGAQGE